jgi:hypothetical protein
MGRQIGAALGVALLVAVLGTTTGTASDFHSAWLISVVGGLTAGLALAAIGSPVGRSTAVPESDQPLISEPIADPLFAEPLVIEDAA